MGIELPKSPAECWGCSLPFLGGLSGTNITVLCREWVCLYLITDNQNAKMILFGVDSRMQKLHGCPPSMES